METDIQNFYKNKTIFLTGGTGFLGKVFIEKTLRVTEVERIYILIRPKRGKDIDERIKDIFKDPLFDKLNKLKPNPEKRIAPIFGDCALPNLGLSPADRATLIENIEIVVHGAATVRFNEPLSNAITINVRGTQEMLDLAKQMIKLKSFVHVSTAFANCAQERTHIEEAFYADKLVVNSENALKLVENLGVDMTNSISKELCKGFPNTYCFTKALGEEAVLTHSHNLPICIFRPGIVNTTQDEPIPGWIDNFYGPTSILFGVAYGVLRVMYIRLESNAPLVPVDYCANALLACAWSAAKSERQIVNSTPTIYNLVPDKSNPLKWGEYINAVRVNGIELPLTRMIWLPFLITTEYKFLYTIMCFMYHTVPGYILDFYLLLLGKRRRMRKTYRKIHKQEALLDHFVENHWTFTMDNTLSLWQSLTPADQRLFKFDMRKIDWQSYMYNSLCGMRQFLSKEDPATIPKAKKLYNRLLLLHRVLQLIVYGGGMALLVWLLYSCASIFL